MYFDKKDIPIIDKFYINDETENKTTKVPEVTLHLKWSDPYITEYCIQETNNVDSCTWISSNGVTEISSNYTFTEQGNKTVYAYIKDIAQGISEVKSDSITYSLPLSEELINNPISGVIEPTGAAEDELATRYYGTNPPNYICFGTTNKSTCTGDHDKYMYRIIGITKETPEHKAGMYKLIKKDALNTAYQWHSSNTDTKWPNSNLYTNLNGSYFLNNNTYVPNGWSSKIETIAWKYGDIPNQTQDASSIIQIEQSWTTTTPEAKIGLMYLADYYYAYKKSGLNCQNSKAICKTSWMHITQNDTVAPAVGFEWTMSRYGSKIVWYVNSTGSVDGSGLNGTYSVRPVFYVTSSAEISGTGTITDPYLIVN